MEKKREATKFLGPIHGKVLTYVPQVGTKFHSKDRTSYGM